MLTNKAGHDNQAGLVSKLVKNGFVVKTRTEAGGGARDVPSFILTLTKQGIEEVESTFTSDDQLLPYATDPLRVNQALLRHDHIVQAATLKSLTAGGISGFLTPRELAHKSEKGVKQPDAVWLYEIGKKTGIEVELSAKWDRAFDQFIQGCITSLKRGQNGEPAKLDRIYVVTDSPAIQSRYKLAFQPGKSFGLWEQDKKSRHWERTGQSTVPDWMKGRVLCFPISRV